MRTLKKYWEMLKIILLYVRFKVRQNYRKTREKRVIETTYGPVQGIKRVSCWKQPFYSFEKIPFAKPPLGELRFRDPVSPNPWTKTLKCTHEADMPKQVNLIIRKIEGTEDCLYLNVYSNNLDPSKPRPVMVWIYGGGFETGTTSKNIYSPDYFMSKDVVLISIAYRVSIFGFLSLKDPSLKIPGNAGLKDQILGLKWVQENISKFGGDPNNVTLFGESAGGASVHYLMITEQAKGLFHKAILMSGSVFSPWAMLPPNDWNHRLVRNMGFKGEMSDANILEFLMRANANDLVRKESKLLKKEELRNRILFASGPVIEPYIGENCIIPKEPRLMAREAWSKNMPIIIGGNSYEGLFAMPDVKKNPSILDKIENCEYLVPLELNLPRSSDACRELGLRLKSEYFSNGEPPLHPYLTLLSYKYFWHGINRTLLSRSRYSNAPTYLYRFDFDSPTFNHIRILCCGRKCKGVAHADDLSYMFYNALSEDLSPQSPEYKTIQTLTGMWTQFAATGNPNGGTTNPLVWDPIKGDGKPFKCLNISYKLSFDELPESKRLEIWDSLYPEEILY